MLNQFIAMGRLCKDPEKRGEQAIVAAYRIAIDNGKGKDGNNRSLFLDCQSFAKTAEAVLNNLRKGDRLIIRGQLLQDDYINRSGDQVRRFVCNVDKVDFVDPKRSAESPDKTPADDVEVKDEDLPF